MISLSDFNVNALSDYPDDTASDYSTVHLRYIDLIENAWKLSLRVGAAIANEFGAHG